MVKMNKTLLNKAIKKFVKIGDIETAKHFIITFGSQIDDYNVEEELKNLEKNSEDKTKDKG